MSEVVVKQLSRAEENIDSYDYRDSLVIEIDGHRHFEVNDGEPEDSNLSRDFNDCYSIIGLMEEAYKLGKEGKEVVFETGDLPEE